MSAAERLRFLLRTAGMHVAGSSWDYLVDPDESARKWKEFCVKTVPARMTDPDGVGVREHAILHRLRRDRCTQLQGNP